MPADFKKLLCARFFFNFAVQMQAVIVGWQMWELTHDALHLGMIGLAEAVPAISLALISGYVVDRSRPVLVYSLVLVGSLLSAMIVLGSQYEAAAFSPIQRVIALYLASVVTGAARSFSQPAMYAIVPRILARGDLSKGTTWSMSTMQTARISGPAVGGLVYGWLGVSAAATLVATSLVIAITALGLVKKSIPAPDRPAERSPRKELLSGIQFVFSHPILLPALSLDMISVFFGGITALLPIYASDILHIGAKGLGCLRAAPAIGAVVASFWLAGSEKIRTQSGSLLFTAVTGFGVCILIFGLSKSILLSLVMLALSGGFDSMSMVIRSTAVQLVSPDEMRGRISAVNSIFIGSSNELGDFESGMMAKFFGPVAATIAGAVICLITVGAAYTLAPALRTLNLREIEAAGNKRA